MYKIEFKKLFGRFNYVFNINEDVTIITGPNGFGKSTILKAIDAVGQGVYGINFWMKLKFEEFRIINSNTKESLIIKKSVNKLTINNKEIEIDFISEVMFDLIRRENYYLKRIEEGKIWDRRKDKIYKTEEFILNNFDTREFYSDNEEFLSEFELRFNTYKNFKNKIFADNFKAIKILEDSKKIIREIYYIKEQRLILTDVNRKVKSEETEFIKHLPEKFKKLIADVANNYSTVANKLDSSYPDRLFSTTSGITKESYEQEMKNMKEKLEKIKKFDISEIQLSKNLEFKPEHAKALKIYFEDFQKKYMVYGDFIERLEMFTNIINNRLTFKKVKISRENGIVVIDDSNKEIELSKLSSGEQQEIVLFYKLIFDVEENVVLLIDEPEISLHILWQKMFMDDLLRIIKFKKIMVVVATHSPQLISNHLDKQIDLGKLYTDEFNSK